MAFNVPRAVVNFNDGLGAVHRTGVEILVNILTIGFEDLELETQDFEEMDHEVGELIQEDRMLKGILTGKKFFSFFWRK